MAHSHEETKAIIVDAAREVFGRFGYKKTTLDDIAASLYKAKSSIYYYFKSKEDVFRAVLEYETLRAKKIIRDSLDKETTPETKLRTYFKILNQFINETTSHYNLLQEEMLEVLSFADEIKKKHKNESLQFIASILKEGIDSGSFSISDIEGTADAIMFAFDGFKHPFYNKDDVSDEQFNNLMNVILYGITAR